MTKVRKITNLSILIAIGVIFSLLDKLISGLIFPSIPGAKIGFANIIILIGLLNYDFKDCMIMAILKSVIAGLLFSGLTTFIIGGIATMVSFLVMYGIKRLLKDKVSMIGISAIGGFTHTLVQLLVIMFIYNMSSDVFIYGIYLFSISLVASVLIGFLSIRVNKIYNKIYKEKEELN